MRTISSTECKTRLGEYLESVRTEPISIEKTGRAVAVLISRAEYDRLVALENAYWLERAKDAETSGFLGVDQSMKLLKEGLDAKAQSD